MIIYFLLFSVMNLHDRWVKDCAVYRELYSQVPVLDTKPKIDWGPLLEQKLVGSSSGALSF